MILIRRCYVCGVKKKMRANQTVCSNSCRLQLYLAVKSCKEEKLPTPLFLKDWTREEDYHLPKRFKKVIKQMAIVHE